MPGDTSDLREHGHELAEVARVRSAARVMQGTSGHSATVNATEDDDEARLGEPVGDRVDPQTEAEKIRALEFMLAGRAEEETQIRMARAVKEVAGHPGAEPRAQLEEALREHQEPSIPDGEHPA